MVQKKYSFSLLFWLYYWNALTLSNDTPTSDIRGKLNAALLTFLIILLKDLGLHKKNTKKKQKRAFVVFLTSVVLYLKKKERVWLATARAQRLLTATPTNVKRVIYTAIVVYLRKIKILLSFLTHRNKHCVVSDCTTLPNRPLWNNKYSFQNKIIVSRNLDRKRNLVICAQS